VFLQGAAQVFPAYSNTIQHLFNTNHIHLHVLFNLNHVECTSK